MGGPGALDGVRVIELGGAISAGYATRLLADLGADVVKVEDEAGDALRPSGGLFRYLNAGKRSVGTVAGADLLGRADVIVENLGPGRLEQLFPGVVGTRTVVRISDFGQQGPYRDIPASDFTVQALGGWVSPHGLPGHEPVQVGGRIPEYAAASFAACAALTAVRIADRTGEPVTVDLSVMECLVGTLAYPMLFQLTLEALGLPPPENRYSVLPGILRCRDGWVGLNALTGQHWQDICAMLGAEEWAGKQRDLGWGGPELDRFYAHVQPVLDGYGVEELVELGQAFRIPAAPVGDGKTLPGLAQFRQRSFFVKEAEGDAIVPGPPWRLSATPAAEPRRAPTLADDRVVWPAEPREPARRETTPPFTGLRIVDLGTFWAAPYATLYLGALGADVIKIESVQRPDGFRFSAAFPQEGADWYERSGLWQATNLNKRDVTLDLSQDEGVAVLRSLLQDADVLIENFSPRVVDQFGLGYDAVSALNPGIVMVRMPGFALEGPWRDYVGWAMSFEQTSGMAMVTGDGDRPINPGGFLDPVVGMHAAFAVQAALAHRDATGAGQLIEMAQVEVGACLTAEQVIEYSLTGRILRGEGNRSPSTRVAAQGVFRCGDGAWVAITVRDEDVEPLGDVYLDLAEWVGGRPAPDVVEGLRAKGVAVAALLTTGAMYDDPQLVARDYYQPIEHPLTGVRRYPGWPMRFSAGVPAAHRFSAPTLGQHNDEVLGGELGLDACRLAELRARSVIGERMAL